MQLRTLLCSAALVSLMAACGPDIPNHSHPDPEPPPPPAERHVGRVEAFSLTPNRIEKGQTAKLSLSTTDAVAVKVTERSGKGVEGVDGTALTGEVTVSPTETTTYVLEAQSEGGSSYAIAQLTVADEGVQIPEEPLLLSAVPDQLVAGQRTSLVWSGPEAVVITDESNTVLPTGNSTSGSMEIAPAATTNYKAKSGTQEVSVVVTVRPVINRFFANPAGAAAGQKVTLHWTTAGAEEVKLSERDRKDLFTAPANLRNEGSFEDTIPAELPDGAVLAYTLTVSNASGITSQTLEFTVSSVPTITEFDAQDVLTRGGSSKPKLSWSTTGAAKVSIYAGRTGTTPSDLLFVAPSSQLASGSIELPLPTESTDFELVAEASQGGQSRERITLKIVEPPAVSAFTITPDTITNPGELAQLSWTTTGGVALRIAPVNGSSIYSTTTDVGTGSTQVTAGNDTEFELVVTNEAGDTAVERRTLSVTQPIGFTYSPPIALPGQQVTMNWDFPTATAVYGAPVGETLNGPEPFIDLTSSVTSSELTTLGGTTAARAEELEFPDGFKFRHFGIPYDSVQVTNRGWISFAPSVSATTITAAIPSTAAPNNFIAAWGADSLSNGHVYWEMVGVAPDRQIIIQWDGFSTGTAGSAMTFELILYERGQVDVRYKEMIATSATVTIGMEDATGTAGFASTFAAPPTANDAATFNGAGPGSGSVTFTTGTTTVEYELLVDLGTARVPVRAALPILAPGSINLTEVMFKPVAPPAGALGQWVEFHNNSGTTLEASHFTLQTGAGAHPLPSHTIPNGSYVVIGQSKDQNANGATPVDIELPGLTLGTSDVVELKLGTAVVSSISYDDGSLQAPAGSSIWPNTGFGSPYCQATQIYGSAGSKGSPGSAGEQCGGYSMVPVAANFRAISGTGTVHVDYTFGARKRYTFPAGFTFPYDGVQHTSVVMGNGYLNFDPAMTDIGSVSDPLATPPTDFPSTPGGVIAPFWDDLGLITLAAGGTTDWFVQPFLNPDGNPLTQDGYIVFEWFNVDIAGTASPDGNMNFEAILYENGDIEFQYAGMESGSKPPERARGSHAVVGISNIAGDQAVVIGNRQTVINPNTGMRFRAQ